MVVLDRSGKKTAQNDIPDGNRQPRNFSCSILSWMQGIGAIAVRITFTHEVFKIPDRAGFADIFK
jgi:hypothetical protein